MIDLGPEISAAATAIGLLDGGELSAAWFENPLKALESILSSPAQRSGLLDLLDRLFPAESLAGTPANEKWHPLLGAQPNGNLYLTTANGGSPLQFGIGGEIHSSTSLLPASLRAHLPVVQADATGVTAIAGTAEGPFKLDLRVELKWSPATGQSIALAAIRASVQLTPLSSPPASLHIVLEGLSIDGSAPADTELNPQNLSSEAMQLVTGLVREQLRQIATPTGEAAAVANNLMPVLGLADGFPAFPFATIVSDASAFPKWLAAIATRGKLAEWIGHLGALLGGVSSLDGSGTRIDPWCVPIFSIDANSGLALTLAQATAEHSGTPLLEFGLLANYLPSGVNPAARIQAAATFVSIPLQGLDAPAVLPLAAVSVVAPGNPATALVHSADISVQSLRAGAQWNGSSIVPLLELDTVSFTFNGTTTPYDRLDLTHADSVVAAAADVVRIAIQAALGNSGAGQHLAALAGIAKPAGDPAWTHAVNFATLISNPAGAIAAVHRAALIDPTHSWAFLLAEVAGLLGISGPVSGTGVIEDPWRVPISSGSVAVELAAWNAQTSGHAADLQQLRIGLRLSIARAPWSTWWLAEILAFDLPATGAGTVALMAGQHAEFLLQPIPAVPETAGIAIAADSAAMKLDWSPGSALQFRVVVSNVAVTAGTTIHIPTLVFPPPGGFDFSHPQAGLGVDSATLQALLRSLVSRGAYSWAGNPGLTLSALLGLHGNLPGLQSDWPVLTGDFLTDPFTALRAWVHQLAIAVSADGSPFLPRLLAWAQAFLADARPLLDGPAPDVVGGSGTYDDPWAVGVASGVDLITWLEPAGPPANWAAPLATQIGKFEEYDEMLAWGERFGNLVPTAQEALAHHNRASLITALNQLESWFLTGDGFVPSESQLPTGGTWTSGALLQSAHTGQPADPAAISQINAQIAALNPADKVVLLVGPAFSDHTIWDNLLTSVALKPNFNLRVAGVDPSAVDLRGVTAAADFYTADLAENGLDGVTAQIGRVVARIAELRPGGPPVTLVAHSSAGLAARAFTAANPASVRGLITLGTPHLGTPLLPLLDAAAGTAIRTINELTPSLPAGPLQDAIHAITLAMDGVLPAAPGQLPVTRMFPTAAFIAPATTDTAGVPALALGSEINVSLFDQVKQALAALATVSAAAVKPAPTHLSFGVRARLDFGAAGEIEPAVTLRVDGARLALKKGLANPARPEHAFTAGIAFSRPGDWIAGSAASNVRVRWAELAVNATDTSVQPSFRLHGCAFESPALGVIDETHPQAQAVLGAMFHAFADLGPAAGAAVAAVLNALTALGITTADPHGGVGISNDAWKALTTDAGGYLTPRIGAAFQAGLGGFSATAPFTQAIGDTPFQVYLEGSSIGIRTTGSFAFSDLASIAADARLSLASFTPSLDLTFSAGAVSVTYAETTGRLTLTAPPWVDSLSLIPAPSASDLAAALNHAIPRLLLSAAASAVLEAGLGSDVSVAPLAVLFDNPGKTIASVFGNGTCLDSAKLTAFLQSTASTIGLPAGPGLTLPGGIELTASGANPVELRLSTTAPIGGVADLQLAAQIDCARHVTPSGAVTLHLGFPGSWAATTITFGVGPSGVILSIAPSTGSPIQILPSFSGLGSLAGAAKALLPQALDALVDAVGPSPLRDDALRLAQAFDLWDPVGKFDQHANQLRALTQGNWAAAVSTAMRSTAIPALSAVLSHVAGTVSVSANTVNIGVGSAFTVALGWDTGPTVSLRTSALRPAGGALSSDISLGFVAGKIAAGVTLGLHLQSSIGVPVVPVLDVAYNGTGFNAKLLPLGQTNESTFAINLLPSPSVVTNGDTAVALATGLLLPIASDLVVAAARPHFGLALWSGGPTLQKLLAGAGIITSTGELAPQMPDPGTLILNLATSFATEAQLTIAGFKLKFVSDTNGLGVNLRGFRDVQLGSVDLKLQLENPDIPFATPGVTIYLFRDSGGLHFSPKVSVAGLGVQLAGPSGGPLVNNSAFRMQSAGGSLFFDFDGDLANLGGAIEAKGVGLPLGLLGGPHDGGNPVASSLLQSAGSGGDPNPVNPAIDVTVSSINGSFDIQLGAPNPPLWIGVHRSFGPIYIEQIGVGWDKISADLLIDGSVKVASLTVQAYELGLNVPFQRLLHPENWSLDLQGLAVGFDSDTVTIAGGLSKNPGPPVEYDGLLSADIAGRGFTVVGGYARPADSQGNFTSLFIFVSLPITLGGPPFLFVTGLGGGAGYNRKLIPPSDLNQIPDFFLVSAIDDASLANNPMGALVSMGRAVPPVRGGYWLAAGVRFNSYVVVNTVAVAYVALDRGFEVGILGLSRMQLPAPGVEIVNIELALKARYSTADQILSIQAQLTDHSWLFSEDCQLTGGFAFFIWFAQGHFVLTMGGYHPSFQKPPEFPDVPRLGFHWQVFDGVQIKGESYFAITSSAFMCGGRLEATASLDGVRAWFTAHVDILIQWDPFHYDFLGGIQVGVSLTIEVCFFGACASVSITISRGADIHVFGPPFHVDLTFDAYITSITLSFGGDPLPVAPTLPWATFRDKYLISGNPENTWVGVRVIRGLLASEPPGAQPSPGSQAQPWKMNPEFAFLTESRMPVSGYLVSATSLDSTGAVIPVTLASKADAKLFDIAPMQKLKVGSAHSVTFTPAVTHPNQFLIEEITDLMPEATWRWYDPAHLPAAANRINAISGLRITGVAVLQGKSALIPISTLVDDDPRFSRPLPFASVSVSTGTLQTAGVTAETLATLAAAVGTGKALNAAAAILTGSGFFAAARQSTGLPAGGIPPLAARALRNDRSAPPLLTPLATGLSMKPVGLPAPPVFVHPGPVTAVPLDQPRLRAVLQARALPTVDAPPAVRTTVTKATAPRMAAPVASSFIGVKLQRVAAATAPAATTIATSARTLRNPDVGALTGAAHSTLFAAAAKSILGNGVTVPAGATHLWELPGDSFSFDITGNAAVRVVYLDRAGNTLQDMEALVSGRFVSTPVPGSEMVAITCLGTAPQLKIAAGFGALSSMLAPGGSVAAVGWQTGNAFPQAGATTILARGAALVLNKSHIALLNNQRTTQGMTPISAALAGQEGIETRLPKSTRVAMILLDRQDATAADDGDLAIACDGATLAVPPVLGAGGNRMALLYDVTSTDPKAEHITIATGSKTGWALAGVIGLPGRAAEWAAQLHGAVPQHLVPDGPLSPTGTLQVRLTKISGGNS